MELEVFAGVSGQVQCLAYASGGATLAVGSENGLVYLWDPSREKLTKVLDGRGGIVTSVAFAPRGSLLAAGYSDCITRLWDIETGRLLHSLKGHQLPVTGVAFAADGAIFEPAMALRISPHSTRSTWVQVGAVVTAIPFLRWVIHHSASAAAVNVFPLA